MEATVRAISTQLNTVLYGPIEPPGPGVYQDVPDAEYHRWAAASNSRLHKLNHSPAHLRWALDNPEDDDTDAKAVGKALHCAVFTPTEFDGLFQRRPPGDGRTKAVQQAIATMQGKFPNARLLKPDDYDNVIGMRNALRDHPITRKILDAAAAFEVSAVFASEGVTCKARADILAPSLNSIFDLKKVARDASPKTFAKALFDYGYIRQAPFYLDGFNAVSGEAYKHFAFIVIEESAPFGISVFELDPEDIERGRQSYLRLLRTYAQCEKSGIWPGLPSVIQYIALPSWARLQLEG